MQKIVFVSIILLIGLFSLQLNLKPKAVGFYMSRNNSSMELKQVNEKTIKNYNGPLIFPIDTIRKYYLNKDNDFIAL